MTSPALPPAAPHPLRSLSAKKANKLRSSWFILGTGFGVLMAAIVLVLDANAPKQDATLTPLAEIAAPADPLAFDIEVQRGDTLISMLTNTGVSYDEAHNVVESIKKVYNPRKLKLGQSLALELKKDTETDGKPSVASLAIDISPITSIQLVRNAKGDFQVSKIEAELFTKQARGGGIINSSLYETGIKAGMTPGMLNEIINAYSYDVDFQRDIQPGNRFDVLFERRETADGTVAGHGSVVYTELEIGGKKLKLYRHDDGHGTVEYFNEKGESIKKALLQTPINGARISSGFGMRRHPVLGYSKMHKGVDFAAATGTPIYAAGDGKVEFAGRKGSYGNYVKVKHNGKYSTAYAHASRIASGIRAGKSVKQGQVIAYVGTTGRSTGPHLHYEVLVGNSQINPKSAKFPTGRKLEGRELADFKRQVQFVNTQLASLPQGGVRELASNAAAAPANNMQAN